MKLTVNGESHEIAADSLTVNELLHAVDVQQRKGIAVARNMRVVPRSAWEDELVADGDEIEIVRATQGG